MWVFNLISGNTTSCGCYHSEVVSKQMTIHGDTKENKTRLYNTWRGMKQRCQNQNSRSYRWYGAKGIQVCPEWENFEIFKSWSEVNGYAIGLELDRINPDDNYYPENCRWVTKRANIKSRDMFWSNELDAKLIIFAKEQGMNPYEVITQAVTKFIGGD
jgi:hypothetical protein